MSRGVVPPYSCAASTISSTTTGSPSWTLVVSGMLFKKVVRREAKPAVAPSPQALPAGPSTGAPSYRPAHRAGEPGRASTPRPLRLVRVDRAARGLFGFPITLLKYHVIDPLIGAMVESSRGNALGPPKTAGHPHDHPAPVPDPPPAGPPTATAIRTCSPPIAGNRAGAATSGAGRYARSRSRRPGGVVVDVASRPPAVAVLGATRPRQQQVIVSPDLLTGQARARMKGSYPGCRATKGVVGEGSGR